MADKLVIGIGTGRCGTMSLSCLLNGQPESSVTHEAIPGVWERTDDHLAALIKLMDEPARVAGDVAFYHLNVVDDLIRSVGRAVHVIVLKRDRLQTVYSYLRKVGLRNMWTHPTSVYFGPGVERDELWEPRYPKYDLPREEALRQYCDDYYVAVGELVCKHPGQVFVYDISALNEAADQRRMLFPVFGDDIRVMTGVHLNATSQ